MTVEIIPHLSYNEQGRPIVATQVRWTYGSDRTLNIDTAGDATIVIDEDEGHCTVLDIDAHHAHTILSAALNGDRQAAELVADHATRNPLATYQTYPARPL